MIAICCSRCSRESALDVALAREFWEWEPVGIRWGDKLAVQGEISADRIWVCPSCFTEDEQAAVAEELAEYGGGG